MSIMSYECKTVSLITVILISFCGAQSKQHAKQSTELPPKYIVDLDKPPVERWSHVVHDFKEALVVVLRSLFGVMPPSARDSIKKIAAGVNTYFPLPYSEEIIGIASAANLTVGEIVMGNIVYDVSTYCTSILARDSGGIIWHARNLDFGTPLINNLTDLLRAITVCVDYQRQGKTVYTAVTFVGYVGIVTAQKPNIFTVSVDTRREGSWWMNVLVAILDYKIQPMSFTIREVLETAMTFREAVFQLADIVTVSDVYYIVGGGSSQEGVVISKGRLTPADYWWLELPPGRWYLVETNYDHWKLVDERRQSAIKLMELMGQDVSKSAIFNVISTSPVLRSDTVYQVVMSAAVPGRFTARISYYDGRP